MKVEELKAKIVQNERMRDKAYQLKPLLTDRNALSQCDTEIRECQKYIDYFHDELAKIESRKDLDTTTALLNTDDNDGSHSKRNSNQLSHDRTSPRPGSTDIKKYSTLGIFVKPIVNDFNGLKPLL